ncbi:MAG: DUF4080 domain-containing protein [Bacillota bacterium]|nr:DUF4080 domain-containing protein [Bacillota bacterium]
MQEDEKMKTVLCAINAKYIHTCLAVHYLKAACRNLCETAVREFTINDPVNRIIWQLIDDEADCYCFSCYIWNIEAVKKAALAIKLALPHSVIIFGGPEVSYNAEGVLTQEPYVDYIISGEGEEALPKLLHSIGGSVESVPNLYYRKDEGIKYTFCAAPLELDALPDAYGDGFEAGRVVYYESSRGCPYSCSFCLSPALGKVRYRSLPKVFSDLKRFISHGVKQVKFVDRTFNADAGRTREIFSYLMKNGRGANFHFEIAAHILDEETLTLLENVEKGLFQFEIGVQSICEKTLDAIGRKQDFSRLEKAVTRLKKTGNIHLHLDLIAGLPLEGLGEFRETLNEVFALKPDMLQLGFLKILHGSALKEETKKYGIVYCPYPPYEVLCTDSLPACDMAVIKGVCWSLNLLCNKGGLSLAAGFIAGSTGVFDFLHAFAQWSKARGYFNVEPGKEGAAAALCEYIKDQKGRDEQPAIELARYCFFKSAKNQSIPSFFSDGLTAGERELARGYFREQVYRDLPKMQKGTAHRRALVCAFDHDVVGYDAGGGLIRRRTYVLFDHATGEMPKRIALPAAC